jgi:O-acetyl-ADP-ribose deacetylase (regulator of RNase III)
VLLLTNQDITTLRVDAIVNAANESLLGGGGVDGAIHRAAGLELKEACRALGGCQAGTAKMTLGFALPSKAVIHAVGPRWRGGQNHEREILVSTYKECLAIAQANHHRTLAFPAISCGAFGFPIEDAASLAVQTVQQFASPTEFDAIFFCTFVEEVGDAYRKVFDRLNIRRMIRAAQNLIEDWSPAKLKQEIEHRVTQETRSILPGAKVFAAIASIQGFDALPQIFEPRALTSVIGTGATEMNRGLSPAGGIPAESFAREFSHGPLYPGAFTAVGHGIYFAHPSKATEPHESDFALVCSETARHYAGKGEGPGCIIRAALHPDARLMTREEARQYFREHRNRAERAGIRDLGIFCAAAGFDAILADNLHSWTSEASWNVLNRSALMTQEVCLQIPAKAVD